jgi:transcription elongation factor Elf1
MSKIIECKKCGGYIETLYQDKEIIECRWCGKSFNRKYAKVIKKIKFPERASTVLQKYFNKNQLKTILA